MIETDLEESMYMCICHVYIYIYIPEHRAHGHLKTCPRHEQRRLQNFHNLVVVVVAGIPSTGSSS